MDFGRGLLIFMVSASLLMKLVKFGVSGQNLENAVRECPEIWCAYLS